MNILILHTAAEIKAWLTNEPLESAEAHVQNGYPDLAEAWQAETLKAAVIEVPDEDAFKADLYEIFENQIRRKPE